MIATVNDLIAVLTHFQENGMGAAPVEIGIIRRRGAYSVEFAADTERGTVRVFATRQDPETR
jgi:hypothetical protein